MDSSFPYDVKQPGGYATGIIKAPAKSVWLVVKDFHSLEWWNPKWTVLHVDSDANKKIRNVQIRTFPPDLLNPDSDTHEELLEVVEKDTWYEVKYIKRDFNIVMPRNPITGQPLVMPFPLLKLE
jgi:hypothetical protein